MLISDVSKLVNEATQEALGKTALVAEDLSNVVDIGTEIFNANAVDSYVRSLINRIGKVVFVNRPYAGSVPSVLRDGWEFGSILEKIQMDIPDATENESWELQDGQSYDPNIFYKPTVSAKFFNKKVTFEVPISIAEKQVKQSFVSPTELNAFVSMIYSAVDKAMTIKLDALVMRLINNMIGETVYNEFNSGVYTGGTGIRAVNLLYEYNQTVPQADQLTADAAIKNPDFIRFASYKMGLYVGRLSKISSLFNIGGQARFTPSDMLHVVYLDEFKAAAGVYLYDAANQFNSENLRLPESESVPYWQGSGLDYGFASTSKISVKTASGHDVEISGILGVMFDRDALAVCCEDRRTTANYNPKAEFYNNWAKWDANYICDTNENFVVFFVA